MILQISYRANVDRRIKKYEYKRFYAQRIYVLYVSFIYIFYIIVANKGLHYIYY